MFDDLRCSPLSRVASLSGSELSKDALGMEQILEEVLARRWASPQKNEGKPIVLENDEEMEPVEDESPRPRLESRG